MSDPTFRLRPGLRREFVRYHYGAERTPDAFVRAGVAGAYLPRVLVDVPHFTQERLSDSVPCCVAMMLGSYGWEAEPERLRTVLRTDDLYGTSGRRLKELEPWGIQPKAPRELQMFRDGSLEVSRRIARSGTRVVYRWEEQWLRFVSTALRAGDPVLLFVELGRLRSGWRGLTQRHAVVLAGGDGRRAWIHDPAREFGPVRVGLSTLMDSLLPGEPLGVVLKPNSVALSLQQGEGE